MRKKGILVEAIDPGSPADRMGLAAGDRCLTLNDHPVEDFLDFQFYLEAGAGNGMRIQKPDEALWDAEFELDEDESLGIRWAPIRPRVCRNKCLFCFVDQLPPGVRPSLRIKDEDYRHSFLHGNFITLGNLSDQDVARILEQRLSPLYVSVHSTNPELRRRMVGCRDGDRFFDYFRALAEGGIALHTQVVLCPGINDGPELDRTLTDLVAEHPSVRSVGIVPVGLTRFRRGRPRLRPTDPRYCRQVIRAVRPHQEEFQRRLGVRFAYLADEFYLQAGMPLPPVRDYDGFPQLANGIGMVRDFVSEFGRGMRRPVPDDSVRAATFATGTRFAPILRAALSRFNRRHRTRFRVLAIRNRFLGSRVSVAGLLAGRDILTQARGRVHGDFLAIPAECLSQTRGVFLDDLSVRGLARELGRPVLVLEPGAAGFYRAICRSAPVGPETP